MITSEKTNNLNKALFDFQSKAGKVTKDSKGNFAKLKIIEKNNIRINTVKMLVDSKAKI